MIIARRFREEYGWQTTFAVSNPNPGQTELDGFKVISLNGRDTHDPTVGSQAFEKILLHYVGYGFQKRGCPTGLLKWLNRWKRKDPSVQLVTMFHELYATGSPWQSCFWISPIQRLICQKMARLSDGLVTSREQSDMILRRMSNRTDVRQLPVFSNVGEPGFRNPFERRAEQMVIFGGVHWRLQALTRDREDVRRACERWGVREILEIGNGETPDYDLGIPIQKLGALPAEDVSGILASSRFGFISYPSSYLEKSGIFAAYAAHGVVSILPARSNVANTLGVDAGRHYLPVESEETSDSFFDGVSEHIYAWYQTHTAAKHAETFCKLIEI